MTPHPHPPLTLLRGLRKKMVSSERHRPPGPQGPMVRPLSGKGSLGTMRLQAQGAPSVALTGLTPTMSCELRAAASSNCSLKPDE